MGCKHPNLDPTVLIVKNALLPAVLCSVMRDMVEETDRGIPRWCTSSASCTFSLSRYHSRKDLARVLERGDSPKTMIKDLLVFRLYRNFPA